MPRTVTTLFKLAPLACACLIASGARNVVRAQGQPIPASVEAKFGIDLYKSGNNDGAVKALRDATRKDKANADAWYYLGLALVKAGKPGDARKAFETTLRLRPNSIAANNGIAYALLTQGKTFEAARALEASLKLDPNNAEAHYLRGAIYFRSDSFRESLTESEAALKTDPNYASALYLKVESLLGMGGNSLANANVETTDVREVLLNKTRERMDEAEATLERFVKLNPQVGEKSSPLREEAAAMREQIEMLRLYSRTGGGTNRFPDGEPYSAKEVTTRAIITGRPEPLYTERARRDQITGTVRLRMVLAADGNVKYIFAVRRLPDGLTEASINAARKIKFIPAIKDGRPVSQLVQIDYNFNIY